MICREIYSTYKYNSNARRSYPSRLVVLVKDKSIDEHIASTMLHCPVLRLAVTTLENGTGISWTFSEIWSLKAWMGTTARTKSLTCNTLELAMPYLRWILSSVR
jgi:hypothetical protein